MFDGPQFNCDSWNISFVLVPLTKLGTFLCGRDKCIFNCPTEPPGIPTFPFHLYEIKLKQLAQIIPFGPLEYFVLFDAPQPNYE